ncbi:MAG: ABC transporter ATP-binding protein [Candidatus Hodarchaeales archaeon]
MLNVQNLSIKYPTSKKWVFQNINFQASRGELVIVAGPSGCGKSTLAQAIIGLIPSFTNVEMSGKITIDNQELKEMTRKELITNIGYLPQYPADFTISLLVEEEIAFPLENYGFTSEEIEVRISSILDQLNISHLRNRLVTEISSGELQRVALASALALKPPILVLDEPMARIDPQTEIILANNLKSLTNEGHLVLAFEHRLDYLLSVADQVIVLDKGQITNQNSPDKILDFMEDIDLPEVSQINQSIINKRPVGLEETYDFMLKKLAINKELIE